MNNLYDEIVWEHRWNERVESERADIGVLSDSRRDKHVPLLDILYDEIDEIDEVEEE